MLNNESVIFSTMVTLLNGVISATIFHRLKKQDSKKDKIFDIRYSEYKIYIRKLEEISEKLRSDIFIGTIDEAMESAKRVNAGTGGQEERSKFIDKILSVLKSVNEFYGKGTNELDGLRLAASPKVYGMVNEFIFLLKEVLKLTQQSIELMNDASAHALIKAEVAEKGKSAEKLREEIIIVMRQELEFDRG